MPQRYDYATGESEGPRPMLQPDDAGRWVSYADYTSVEGDLLAVRKELADYRKLAQEEIDKRVEAIKEALVELKQQGAELEQLRDILATLRERIDVVIPRPDPPGLDALRGAFEDFARKLKK